jgi:hypothetical protein
MAGHLSFTRCQSQRRDFDRTHNIDASFIVLSWREPKTWHVGTLPVFVSDIFVRRRSHPLRLRKC